MGIAARCGAAAGGGDGAGAGAAPVSSAVPQDMQNFAASGLTVPQFGHARSSTVPQDMQNFAAAGFDVPHV